MTAIRAAKDFHMLKMRCRLARIIEPVRRASSHVARHFLPVQHARVAHAERTGHPLPDQLCVTQVREPADGQIPCRLNPTFE